MLLPSALLPPLPLLRSALLPSALLPPPPPIPLAAAQLLASNVLNPASIDVRLDDIGGLEHVKEEMVSILGGG